MAFLKDLFKDETKIDARTKKVILSKILNYNISGDKIAITPTKENPNLFELVDYSTKEEKEMNRKYYNRVNELEEQEWNEFWEILKGQDYKKFDKDKDWDDQFDGSGIQGWWD